MITVRSTTKRKRSCRRMLTTTRIATTILLTLWMVTLSIIPWLLPKNNNNDNPLHHVHESRGKRQWWNRHQQRQQQGKPPTTTTTTRKINLSAAAATTTANRAGGGDNASNSTCCWQADHDCCDRRIYRSHKMGFILMEKLFSQFHGVRRMEMTTALPSDLFFDAAGEIIHQQNKRYVIVTRNYHDAIVSGYLYHKSGRECWLSEEGKTTTTFLNRKRYSGWLQHHDWERRLRNAFPWKPRQGRSLCQYLAQESEQDGMRVYMDWSMTMWYDNILQTKIQSNQWENNNTFILFVCYEALADPTTQQQSAERILQWLYPGQLPTDATTITKQLQLSEYHGGHATTKDDKIRGRLRALVQSLDETIFDGQVKKADNELQCF